MKRRGRRGQAALEYVLATCTVLAVVAAMGWMLMAARRSVARTETLVGSDYP